MNKLLLRVVEEYSRKWRFSMNVDKCKYMVFGEEKEKKTKLKLSDYEISQVKMYKYLGIDLNENLNWKDHIERIYRQAKRRYFTMFSFNTHLQITTKAAVNCYQMIIRPILEYGSEIWSSSRLERLEQFQREVGKRILRIPSKSTNEAVLGELGWVELADRVERAKLRLFKQIVDSEERNIAQRILDYRMKNGYIYQQSFGKSVHKILMTWKLDELTARLTTVEEWRNICTTIGRQRAEQKWKEKMNTKPKLRTYVQFKSELKLEDYLMMITQRRIY